MSKAVIALGSNMGDRIGNLSGAVSAVSKLIGVKITGVSCVYETEPVGKTDQNRFYNAAILIETSVSPQVLLGECLGIEAAMGRIRTEKNGPRVIDLDLILYENFVCDTAELCVPHPRALERSFVTVPLLDLFPSGNALGTEFASALEKIGTDGIYKTTHKILISD